MAAGRGAPLGGVPGDAAELRLLPRGGARSQRRRVERRRDDLRRFGAAKGRSGCDEAGNRWARQEQKADAKVEAVRRS